MIQAFGVHEVLRRKRLGRWCREGDVRGLERHAKEQARDLASLNQALADWQSVFTPLRMKMAEVVEAAHRLKTASNALTAYNIASYSARQDDDKGMRLARAKEKAWSNYYAVIYTLGFEALATVEGRPLVDFVASLRCKVNELEKRNAELEARIGELVSIHPHTPNQRRGKG